MTLGKYPDMSLANARIEAREKRTMLDKQRDPLLCFFCGRDADRTGWPDGNNKSRVDHMTCPLVVAVGRGAA
jgi:hypothetical protein